MKIYGGHDYYDGLMAYGTDPRIVLVRGKIKPISWNKVPDIPAMDLRMWIDNRYTPFLLRHLVVVLGRMVYHGLAVKSKFGEVWEYIWSIDKLEKWLEKHPRASIKTAPIWSRRKHRGRPVSEYFQVEVAPLALQNFMIERRIAILLDNYEQSSDERGIQVNPFDLKVIGFAKALDPYMAYQELSMWIGGVLGGSSPEIVKIADDVTLLEGHGFDKVTSFRGPRIK